MRPFAKLSRKRQDARASYGEGVSFGVMSVAVVALLGVVSSIVTARVYGIEIIGQYALVFAPVGICSALSTLQEQAGLGRELAVLELRAPRVTGLFWAVQVFSTVLTLVVAAIVGAIAYLLFNGPIGQPELFLPSVVLLAEYVLVSNTSWNLDMVFAAYRAGRQLFWVRLAHAVAFFALSVALGLAWHSVWALVIAQGGAALISLTWRAFAVITFMRPVVSREEIAAGMAELPVIVRFGAKLAPAFVSEGVAHEMGAWILGVTSTLTAVGAWSRSWGLARRMLDPGVRVAEILYPTLVERRARGAHRDFDGLLVGSARYLAVGMLLPAAVGGGAAVGVMELYGPNFAEGATALAIILLVPVLYCIATVELIGQTAANRPGTAAIVTVVRATAIACLGIGFSAWLGVTGMAIGYVSGYALDVVWRTRLTLGELQQPLRELWPLRKMAATVLAYLAGFATARVLDSTLHGAVGLGVALLIGSAAYLGVFVAAGGLTEEDRDRIAALRDRLRVRRSVPAESAAAP